jgi:predicted RNase H-like nuclease
MHLIGGADGCKGGWVLVTQDLRTGFVSWQRCSTAWDLFYRTPDLAIMALDIPIGLAEKGPRVCDQEARRLLKRGRASSVFPSPVRTVLSAATYAEACRIRTAVEGKKLSRQAWAITPKIREVDDLLRRDPQLRAKTHEVHPELCFYHLAGGKPCRFAKKVKNGREERRRLLEPRFGEWLARALAGRSTLAPCAEDDVLDAFAALWSAERIATGRAITLPIGASADSVGLRMEIWA